MKQNESKKPLWAQNKGQAIGRKTRKKAAEPGIVFYDIETVGLDGDLMIYAARPNAGKTSFTNRVIEFLNEEKGQSKRKPTWADSAKNKPKIVDVTFESSEEATLRKFAAGQAENEHRMRKFIEKAEKAGDVVHNTNFMQVIPDSHFWSDLDMLLQWAQYMPESKEKHHLIKGLENTKKNGYNLVQLGQDHAQAVPGTFAKHYDYLRTERVAMTQDEFVKTIVNNRPTEIYCKHWSADKPLYYIVAHYDFVQTRVRKQTPSVRIQSAFEDKAQRIYLPALYRKLTTEHQHRMPFTSLEFK